MILKVSKKYNINGWREQLIIDLENKTIKAGAFLFHSGDIDDLTGKQFEQLKKFYINNNFKEV